MRCRLVKYKSLISISNKALLIEDFNSNKAIIPKSQVFGFVDGSKSNGVYIADWLIVGKGLQYSNTIYFYNKKLDRVFDYIIEVEEHIPDKIDPISDNIIKELKR